jgi:hypothetical protein
MNRKDLITHNLSYIFLALAVLAVSMVLVSLIQPMELPVPYASSNKVSLVPVLNRGQLADTARWQGLADAYNHQRALQADAARWQGLADAYYHQRALQADTGQSSLARLGRCLQTAEETENLPSPARPASRHSSLARLGRCCQRLKGMERDVYKRQRALQADTDRWQGLADAYALQTDADRWQDLENAYDRQLALQADPARWQSLAEETLKTSAAAALTKAQQADAARWNALANDYFIHNGGLSGNQLAEALRWTAMALHYGVEPVYISPQLKFLLGK